MTEAPTVLSIEGLHVAYGSVQAIKNVSLTVNHGEAVALIGANGAGKSTLFKAAIGLLRPRSGRIALSGRALDRISARGRALLGIGYSPEGRRIFPGLSVRENLEVAVRGGARDRAERLAMAFDLFPALGARQAAPGWQLSGASSRCWRSDGR
jgi:branched-chain amino acid transport system ATP-binding protein